MNWTGVETRSRITNCKCSTSHYLLSNKIILQKGLGKINKTLPRPCLTSLKGNKQQQQGEHSIFHVFGSAAESSCYNYLSCSPQQRFLLFLTKPKNKNGGEYRQSGSVLFSLIGQPVYIATYSSVNSNEEFPPTACWFWYSTRKFNWNLSVLINQH